MKKIFVQVTYSEPKSAKIVKIVFKMSISDLQESRLSRVRACLSQVRARLSQVRACLSGVRARLSSVWARLELIHQKYAFNKNIQKLP